MMIFTFSPACKIACDYTIRYSILINLSVIFIDMLFLYLLMFYLQIVTY